MKDIRVVVNESFGRLHVYNAYPTETAEEQFEETKKFYPEGCRLATPEEIGISNDMSLEEQFDRLLTLATNTTDVYREGNKINVAIEYGDWKHDHRFADQLVEVAFGEQIKGKDEIVTEQDGSDTYSAEHIYEVEEDDYER